MMIDFETLDKIYEDLEMLETYTPKTFRQVEPCNYTFGDWRYSYLMYVPFVSIQAREENKMNFYVVYRDNYQYSEVFDSYQRAEEYLTYVQTMEPKSNLHIESILEKK